MKISISNIVIISVFCFALLISCSHEKIIDEDTKLEHATELQLHEIKQGDVDIIVIDGCEYIIYKETDGANRAFGYMSHKGNCKNPIHQYHIEKSDSIIKEGLPRK